MDKGKEILNKIKKLTSLVKSNKFLGAMTIEVVRKFLKKEGFKVSERNSFIKGVPNEIDLLILKKDSKPLFNSHYEPKDVLFVFEIKFRGSYGESDKRHVREMFDNVKKVNSEIRCIYLAISENRKYKHRATDRNINGKVFELLKRDTSLEFAIKKGTLRSGDWKKLIDYLS